MSHAHFDPATVPRLDHDGRLHVRAPILNRGVHRYAASEIPDTWDDGERVVRVWRSPAELRKAASSFEGVPILRDHPPRDAAIDPNQVVGMVGRTQYRDDCIVADIVVWDSDAIENIRNGSQADLSAGYAFAVSPTPLPELADAAQANIRGHHVALVDKGRNGSACSLKHLSN